MYRCCLTTAMILLIALPVLSQERPQVRIEMIDIKGVVLDAKGEALANAHIAAFWDYRDGAWSPRDGVRTDDEGRFTLPLRTFPDRAGHAYRVMATDAAGKAGAFVTFARAAFEDELKLTPHPMVNVSARLKGEGGIDPEEGSYINLFTADGRLQWLCSTRIREAAFSFRLPPGRYQYRVAAGKSFQFQDLPLVIEPGSDDIELPVIQLERTALARSYGKDAPAIGVAAVRNLPEDLAEKGAEVTIADFKGRWVMVEFWGFW